MKTLLVPFLAAWFIRTPSPSSLVPHPLSLPTGATCTCTHTSGTVLSALDAARTTFLSDGWTESSIHPSDTLIFTRAKSVAFVLAQPTPAGIRVTTYISSPSPF